MFKALKIKRIFLSLIIISPIALGEAGLASLKIVPGAREAAMASTGVASAQGPSAIYFNPAQVSRYTNFLVNLYYAKWFFDTHHQSLFLVRPTKLFNIGFGMVNFSYGKVEKRKDKPTDEIVGYFIPQDYSFFLALSRALDERTAIGVSGKFYWQKIEAMTASSGGLDMGVKFQISPQFDLGFSIINFGSTLRYEREKFWLPTETKAGLSYNINFGNYYLIGAADFSYFPFDKRFGTGIGFEFAFDKIALRAGVRPFAETGKFSAGLGIKWHKFRLEYATTPYTYNLGVTHRFAIGFGY